MPLIDDVTFYSSAIQKHGITAKGVNWASKENQLLRFKIILDFLPKDLTKFTIVDAGCGFGDFYNYLLKKKRVPKKYIGIDSLLDMHSIASNATGQEIIHADICKDKLPTADYYVCSGALNVLTPFESYQFIQNCYASSRRGFIFNALYGDKESETYNYIKPSQIKNMLDAMNVTTKREEKDYIENDITLGFYR